MTMLEENILSTYTLGLCMEGNRDIILFLQLIIIF